MDKKKGQWAYQHGQQTVKSKKSVQECSVDEMWTYQNARHGQKRDSLWIWTYYSLSFVWFCVGHRDQATFEPFYEDMPKANTYYTDDYDVYAEVIAQGRHQVGKGRKTNRNETLHSLLRDRLARLKRETKAYTRSPLMLAYSIALVLWKNHYF
jgi:IS1 family transposase